MKTAGLARTLFILLAGCGVVAAQDLSVYVHTPGSPEDGAALGGNYSFPDTAQGNTSAVVLRFKNTGSTTSYLVASIYFSDATPFQITGDYLGKCVAPGGSEDVTAIFAPVALGAASEDLSMSFAGNPAAQGCPENTTSGAVVSVATFHGTGLASVIGGGGIAGSLTLTYVALNGSTQSVESGGTVNFGRIEQGSSDQIQFTLLNTSGAAVTLAGITVSGGVFSRTGLVPSPLVIGPGNAISFGVQFLPNAPTPFAGTLAIGSQTVSLSGIGTQPPMPLASLHFDTSSFANQQQDHVTVTLASASPISATGTLALTFTPAVANVNDDPAVMFLATGGRNLTVQVNPGSQTAFYNGQSAITFQTGTTAGKLTFTLTFAGQDPVVQTIDLLPTTTVLTASTAVRQVPSLVVTLTGYDNTYSAGKLTFIFYSTSGAVMTPGGLIADETQAFQQYFFNQHSYGGAFQLQANFPVTGDVTGVGSVDVTIQSSAGTSATKHLTFQ